MSHTPLLRKTPMARGTSSLKRAPFKRSSPRPRKTTPPKVRDTPRAKIVPTAVERAHMGRVAELGCVVCLNLGHSLTPAEVHHVRCFAGAGQRANDFQTIPLCPWHHRLGGSGVAFHAGPLSFERNHGSEEKLLAQTLRTLGFEIEPEYIPRADLGALLYPKKES